MIWLVAAAAVLLLASSSSSSSSSSNGSALWAARRAALRQWSEPLELAWGWPGLADYLEVVAWQESRGRLDAVGDGGLALGPHQVHSTSTASRELGQLGYSADAVLRDPRLAVAVAARHAARLLLVADYHYPRDDARWADVRAGWALPGWVGRRDAPPSHGKDRPGVVARHRAAAARLGLAAMPDALARPAWFPTLGQVLEMIPRT